MYCVGCGGSGCGGGQGLVGAVESYSARRLRGRGSVKFTEGGVVCDSRWAKGAGSGGGGVV